MGDVSSWFARVFRTGGGAELIAGVVDPRGAAGANNGQGTPWILQFTLDRWRGADGSLQSTPLDVRRECTDAELRSFMAQIDALSVIGARVRLTGPRSAELVALAGRVNDAELAVRAAELATWPTREDARFGTLRLNLRLRWWEGEAEWDGDRVDLHLSVETDEEQEAALRTARALWDDQASWSERIQAFAVQELLPVKNESWLDEDEQPLSSEQFRDRMRLQSISAGPEGDFEFWHDDGDLFYGHSIQVWGTLTSGPKGAGIHG